MNCTRFESRIALYVGDDLPLEEIAAVEAHLAQCPACHQLVDGLRDQRDALAGAQADVPSDAAMDDVRRRVLAVIARGDAQPSWAEQWWAFGSMSVAWRAIGVAAAALVVGAIWLWLPRSPNTPPPSKVEPAPLVTQRQASPPVPVPALAPVTPSSVGDTHPPAAEAASTPPPGDPDRATRDTGPRPVAAPDGPHPGPGDRASQGMVPGVPAAPRATGPEAGRLRSRAAPQPPPLLATVEAPPSPTAPLVRRIEWQTADPNIRIIWLVQDPAPPVNPVGPTAG